MNQAVSRSTHIAVITTLLLAIHFLSADEQPAEKASQDARSLTLTIEGDLDSELAPVAGELTTLFYECYPKLLARFENAKKTAPRKVHLVFKDGVKVPGYSHRDTVVVSTKWLKEHPQDIGLFTHELAHLVQGYPSPDPGWLTEGIADYARALYGPKEQPEWSLPKSLSPNQSYKNSYGITARFLVWLEEKHPGTVDQLHRKMQERTFKIEDFEELTKKDVETLWRECVMELSGK